MTRSANRPRGYVMVVVLLILAVLLSAGLYGVRALESDLRSSSHLRKSEILARAAEAGAAHRIAEIAMAREDAGSALATSVDWTEWPDPATISTVPEVHRLTLYQVTSEPIARVESRPPAGEQIGRGGQSTIWSITSYAISSQPGAAGEHAVSMGVKVWSRGGTSYNN